MFEWRIFGSSINLGFGQAALMLFSHRMALHHLNPEEKRNVVAQSLSLLQVGGWLLNADLIVAESPQMEKRIQELRIQGILDRANREDARFRDAARQPELFSTRSNNKTATSRKRCGPICRYCGDAGVRNASVFWLEYREAVLGGQR